MGSWNMGEGADVLQTKYGGGSAYHTTEPTENLINGKLFDKNMKFCIFVVHDLTNDISYDAKLNK